MESEPGTGSTFRFTLPLVSLFALAAPLRATEPGAVTVRVADGQRDGLLRHLRNEKIGCEIYYPMPLHLQECLAYLGHQEGDFPVSESACRSVLALPMFPELSEEQQQRVVQSCAMFLRTRARMAA